MNQNTLDKAKNKIDRVIFSLWKKDGVLFGALSMLDKVPSSSYDTIGIDLTEKHRVSLKYNPNFINSISIERLELVLFIEGMRVLLRHCTTRLQEPGNISHLASSLAINQLMNDDLDKILQGFDEVSPDPKRFGLPDKQAFEEYFRELLEKADKTDQIIQQIWQSMSDDQKKELIEKAMEGSGEGENEGKDSDNFKSFANEKEALKEYSNPNGNAKQGWKKNNSFDSDIKAYIDKVKNKTKMWGKYTSSVQAGILEAFAPKINCKDIIRRFSSSILTGKTEPSRMKINRRFDIERPGYRRTYKPNIIVAIDNSGSMSDENLKFGFGLVNKILYFAQITFIQFDCEIQIIEKNFNKARKEFSVKGRGGTNYQPIFDYAEKNKCDGLIIFTDGYAPAVTEPKFKVLWMLSQKDQKPPVNWGMVTVLDRLCDERM